MNPNTEPILDAANKFLWSDGMQESLDTFATNYAEMFVGVRRKLGEELLGEQRLEWTEAHNEVCAFVCLPARPPAPIRSARSPDNTADATRLSSRSCSSSTWSSS